MRLSTRDRERERDAIRVVGLSDEMRVSLLRRLSAIHCNPCPSNANSYDESLHSSQPTPASRRYDAANARPYVDVTFLAASGTSLRPAPTLEPVLHQDVPLLPLNENGEPLDLRPSTLQSFVKAHWLKFGNAGWGSFENVDWATIYIQEVLCSLPQRRLLCGSSHRSVAAHCVEPGGSLFVPGPSSVTQENATTATFFSSSSPPPLPIRAVRP